MKPNRLAVYGLTAGLLGGGAAGLLLTGTTLASAQVSDVTGTVTAPTAGSAKPAKGEWAKSVLDGLAAKGTITQAQADEILAALNAARPAHGPRGHGPGRGGFAKLDAAATALGMTVEDLRSALEGGKSLAAVAQEKGIDVAKVVDALVAEFKVHLDQEVASGIHTQAEADQKLADARARLEAFVNGTAPPGGPGGFGGGRHGRGPGDPRPGSVAPEPGGCPGPPRGLRPRHGPARWTRRVQRRPARPRPRRSAPGRRFDLRHHHLLAPVITSGPPLLLRPGAARSF